MIQFGDSAAGAPAVRGSVDAVTETEVRGWAFASGRARPVTVQATLHQEIVGEAVAALHRPDLASAGLGDGNSGYVMALFRPIDPLYLPFLTVRVDGGDAELPRAPSLGYAEFFAALYRAHPAAGRSRSVFGGLWTDRTDAAALLHGKLAIGQIAPGDTAAGVARLIESGLHVAPLERTLPARDGADAVLDLLCAALEDPVLLPLLRAVLEDNPVVVRAERAAPLRDDTDEGGFAQPSAGNPSPSPAECLAVVVPLADGVTLDVVRDSHRLPEFTPAGLSRWAGSGPGHGVAVAGAHGMLDRWPVPFGTVAAIGPGTVFRAIGPAGHALVVPARAQPLSLALAGARHVVARGGVVRAWA